MTKINSKQREQILEKLNSGDAHGAISLINELIVDDANNPDLLGLLAIALEEAGDVNGAAETLRSALALPADLSIQLRNASNLASLLYDANKREDVVDLLRKDWRWPADTPLDPKSTICIKLLAKLMNFFKMPEELIAFLSPIITSSQHDWEILRYYVLALAETGQFEESVHLVDKFRTKDSCQNERLAMLAFLYSKSGESEKAEAAGKAYFASAPAYLSPARPGQRFTIGVINPLPPRDRLLQPADKQHFVSNFPAFMAQRLADRYRFASIMLGAGPAAIEKFCEYKPAVVINNVVNSEFLRNPDHWRRVKQITDTIDSPLINTPEFAAKSTRQINSMHLSQIPGMVTPLIKRFNRHAGSLDELIIAIEQSFAYPMIVRTTHDHNSANMTLVDTAAMLRELLVQMTEPQIYVIQYVGAPRRDGFFRRIRAAFVEGAPIIIRADYAPSWIVRSRSKIPRQVYQDRPDLLADADDIIERPQDRLGAAGIAALEAVGRMLKLDIFGMDFDYDDHGRIIFFEANASMNLFPNTPPEFPYPSVAEATLVDRIDQLLISRSNLADASTSPIAPNRLH